MSMREAQQAYGLTARALRHYDEWGLVTPQRDQHNRRYFTAEAMAKLEWIAALRQVDLSLLDIAEILLAEDDGSGVDLALTKLAERQARLAAQAARIEGLSRSLRARAERISPPVRAAHG
jgi:DNA-binding transcriptional MerR regulator